ncbi:MAG: hypothetical protein IJC74_03655 [Clostridia bacterium]|nr:hypothetical protein [Clostridia bacterium]
MKINNLNDLINLVDKFGFLPFFKNGIDNFSIEEFCPEELWISADKDGPWEWKGPVIQSGNCIYGKFFNGKAGFISKKWIPHFVNYRRDGYDFDTRYDDGLANYKDKELYDTIEKSKIILSKDLKHLHNYCKDGKKGFDTVITRLQMESYVCVADFVYMKDKFGKEYGWGVAEYTTPESVFGYDFVTSEYKTEPMKSKEIIIDYLKKLLPLADEKQINKLIK